MTSKQPTPPPDDQIRPDPPPVPPARAVHESSLRNTAVFPDELTNRPVRRTIAETFGPCWACQGSGFVCAPENEEYKPGPVLFVPSLCRICDGNGRVTTSRTTTEEPLLLR